MKPKLAPIARIPAHAEYIEVDLPPMCRAYEGMFLKTYHDKGAQNGLFAQVAADNGKARFLVDDSLTGFLGTYEFRVEYNKIDIACGRFEVVAHHEATAVTGIMGSSKPCKPYAVCPTTVVTPPTGSNVFGVNSC